MSACPDLAATAATASVPASSAAVHQCLLGFDFGTRRVGVATGSTLLGHARPLCTLSAHGDARFDAIAKLIAEWQPDALVVGVPLHPDGRPHATTAAARRFARQLQGRFRLPVHEVDERFSSVEAEACGAQGERIDAEAAAVILQQHLDELARMAAKPD